MSAPSVCRACLRSTARQCTKSSTVARTAERSLVASTNSSRPHHTYAIIRPSRPLQTTALRSYASQAAPPPPPQSSTPNEAEPEEEDIPTDREFVRGATEALFKECALQADYIVPQAFKSSSETPKNDDGEELGEGSGWWYESMGIDPTFRAWAQITMLHMHLLVARMRYFPAEASTVWAQQLTDHFFYEAEHRMTIFHQITSRAYRNRYLKELHNQWRGVMGAYDEGIARGDAVLATAVWRNIFNAKEGADWRNVAAVVAFVRRVLAALDRSPDRAIVNAMVKFGNPLSGMPVVMERSKAMDEPFSPEDEEVLKQLWDGNFGKKDDK